MPAPFAAPVADLGASVIRTMRNCTVRFNGGPRVDGIFRNRPEVAAVGTAGAFARLPQVQCLSDDVQGVEENTSAEIESAAIIGPYYMVRERLPDDLHAGIATFMLEPAP
jgi:hypothetical protein